MINLFTREGKPYGAAPSTDDKGRVGYWITSRSCGRCGGAGRADKWRHTGLTCYDCGGSGTRPCERFAPLYSAEKLAKLNETHAKAHAKRQAAAAAAHAAELERRAAERADVMAAHAPMLKRIAGLVDLDSGDSFLADMYRQVTDQARPWSQGQREAAEGACDRIEAERARKAVATHVGTVGGKVELTLTRRRLLDLSRSKFDPSFYIWTFRDAAGNTIVYKGGLPKAFEGCNADGDTVTCTATVKAHDVYNGEPQTIIARPAPVKIKEAA